MYQQSSPYSNDGATKISGGAAANTNGMRSSVDGYGNRVAYGSGYGASGFGAGGYGGAAGYGSGSMYGGGSAYGDRLGAGSDPNNMYGGGVGSMMGDMNENIIVTKLFSSRRDLDRLASSVDFSRRFDSNWGSYRSAGADGYGGSIYRNGAGEAGSLMNLPESRDAAAMMDHGVGAAGMGPDGSAPAAAAEVKERCSTPKTGAGKAPRNLPSEATRSESSAKKPAAEKAEETARKTPAAATTPQAAPERKPAETRPTTQGAPAKLADNSPKTTSRDLPMQELPHSLMAGERRTPQAQQPQQPPAQPSPQTMKAREAEPTATKLREAPPIDDIPLLADDALPKEKIPTPAVVRKAPTPREVVPPPAEPAKKIAEPAKGSARPTRPRSRSQSRPQSRMTSMSVVEFPVADEVRDEMVADGLKDPEKEAALASAREEQKRQREEASRQARLERAKQRQQQEDQQKQRDEEARRARDAKTQEERRKKELIAKMDEEKRKERAAALAERERKREEEKRRFEETKRMEDEKEAARAAALVAERQRRLAMETTEQEKPYRPASRPRSRRPVSRPNSNLRGAIPEQPPDVIAGQIKDTLADDNLGKPMHTATREIPANDIAAVEFTNASRHSGEHHQRSPQSESAQEKRSHEATPRQQQQQQVQEVEVPVTREVVNHQQHLEEPKQSTSHEPSPALQQVRVEKRAASTPQQQTAPAAQKERNMVKTFVLVEAVRQSNHAVQHTPKSITYHGQTINVTELRVREEDVFNYNSTVVHDVREAACNGYNAAVLSMDTANTAGRFDSPVWSILNRVVRTLLKENSNEAGNLRENFELTCAMGYLYHDKVKDMFAHEGEAQFTKVAVNPSPIYGPRLTNLKYDVVTDPVRFEELLSTTLSQSIQDPSIANLTEGVLAAFVLVKQSRETAGKPDIYLSSLVIASSGEDPVPYQSAISHTRNEYATVFHLVLGGPSCTCFMLNIADDDTVRKSGDANQQSVPDGIDAALRLLAEMANLQNYDLRSGSVKRFIKYVERSHTNAKQRLAREQDESQRRKVERYLKEQERLLDDAYSLLRDANIPIDEEL